MICHECCDCCEMISDHLFLHECLHLFVSLSLSSVRFSPVSFSIHSISLFLMIFSFPFFFSCVFHPFHLIIFVILLIFISSSSTPHLHFIFILTSQEGNLKEYHSTKERFSLLTDFRRSLMDQDHPKDKREALRREVIRLLEGSRRTEQGYMVPRNRAGEMADTSNTPVIQLLALV